MKDRAVTPGLSAQVIRRWPPPLSEKSPRKAEPFVLASATGQRGGDPHIVDETLNPIDPLDVRSGDVVGIGIHTGNALRGYSIGQMARARGAWVVFGGIHATLFADEAGDEGGRARWSKGTAMWSGRGSSKTASPDVRRRCTTAGVSVQSISHQPRWDLLPEGGYMWGSVQTVRGCPKHCSFVRY